MRGRSTPELIAFATFVIVSCVTAPASATCPAGSQFFAYGGAGGCVKPGSNEVVVKCFRNPSPCATGWSTEYAGDEKWCCPPAGGGAKHLVCRVDGTSPFCHGTCREGEIVQRVGVDAGQKCLTGVKVLCCHYTESQ
jgi:hypothetical protein